MPDLLSPQARVLIVEDDYDIALGLSQSLEMMGYSVLGCVDSGEEAIKKAVEMKPEVILMDIWLKGKLDGIEAAAEIQKQSPIPIIYLSSHSDRAVLERAKATQYYGYIFKPFDMRDLQIQIEICLSRHRVERMLSESADLFKSILQWTPDSVMITDTLGRIVFWNNGARLTFGYDEKEVIGKPFSQFIPQRFHENHSLIVELTRLSGQSETRMDLFGLRKSGAEFPIELSLSVWKSGVHSFFSVIIRDATLKKKEADSHYLLEKALENTQVGVTIADAEGKILFTNAAEARMHGYSVHELVGKSVRLLAPEQKWSPIPLHDKRILGGYHRETINIDRNGRTFPVEIVSDVVRDSENKPIGVVSCTQDISERKKLEEKRQLIESAQLKSEFVANVSHELRTPLNAVIGTAGLLFDTQLNSEQREYALLIKQAGQTLLALINDVLDYSKLESGKMELENVDFNLKTAIRECVELFEYQARTKNLEIRIDTDPSTPQWVKGDPGRLRQVLVNLIGNAVKFTNQGSVVIKISPEPKTDQIRFEVIDTGIGIQKSALAKLFQAFSQANASMTREFGGTGLGLSICKNIIALMKGSIHVHSEFGKGSTFEFTIPLAKSENAIIPEIELTQTIELQGRVLVVEDNPINQKVISRIIEKLGCRVDMVGNGREALDALLFITYDIILMDCQMPILDGYEATTQIRKNPRYEKSKNIPIIAMTAHAMSGDKEKCLASGMNEYLCKPVDPLQVRLTLAKYLRKRKNEPESLQAIDRAVLDDLSRLKAKGKPDLAGELIEIFFDQAPKRMKAIHDAVVGNSAPALAKETHTLRSSCAHVGAKHMSELCKEMEELARKNDMSSMSQRIAKLDQEFDKVKNALEKEAERIRKAS